MISKDKSRVRFYSDGSIAWSNFPVISDYEYFGWVWWGDYIREDEYKLWREL